MIPFPEVPPGDSVTISASAFVAFEQCPEQGNARFRGEYGPPSRASFVGGLAHRLFARHLQRGPISDEAFDRACREEIGSAAGLNLRMGELGLKPSTIPGIVGEAKQLYDRFRRFPDDGFQGAEVDMEVEPSPGVTLRGRVDAVFDGDGLRLVDWKTGQLGEVGDQLHFYALLWALDRGELPTHVEAVSVKTGERQTSRPGVEELTALAERVGNMVTSLRDGWARQIELERTAGPWCRFCPLLEGCREGRAAREFLARA